MNEVISFEGSPCSSSSVNVFPAPARPLPNTRKAYVAGSIVGVAVWFRTKNRSFGVVYHWLCIDAHFISAFEPKTVKRSAGSGLTIGVVAARAVAARKRRTAGNAAAPSPSAARRESPRPQRYSCSSSIPTSIVQ
jgi:hypothetical protein